MSNTIMLFIASGILFFLATAAYVTLSDEYDTLTLALVFAGVVCLFSTIFTASNNWAETTQRYADACMSEGGTVISNTDSERTCAKNIEWIVVDY